MSKIREKIKTGSYIPLAEELIQDTIMTRGELLEKQKLVMQSDLNSPYIQHILQYEIPELQATIDTLRLSLNMLKYGFMVGKENSKDDTEYKILDSSVIANLLDTLED